MSVQNQIIRNSGRALANAISLAGVKVVDSYALKSSSFDVKNVAIDSAVIGVATLVSGVANGVITGMISLPKWVLAVEASYGLDLINLAIYVIGVYLIHMKMGNKESLIKILIEGVAALVGGAYVVGPLNNLLPIGMVAK